jgi:hypothetical protein
MGRPGPSCGDERRTTGERRPGMEAWFGIVYLALLGLLLLGVYEGAVRRRARRAHRH